MRPIIAKTIERVGLKDPIALKLELAKEFEKLKNKTCITHCPESLAKAWRAEVKYQKEWYRTRV
jgi:hypothetical protein